MSHTPELIEYSSHPPETTDSLEEALFPERLDTFMHKSLADIRAFAQRESRSYDETRRIVAEWHAKSLFNVTVGGFHDDLNLEHKGALVREILIETSNVLESLSEVLGIQSFVLAVDPQDPQDAGFLGGSLVGREFYRGLRGGGTAGASSFKTFAQKRFSSVQAQEEVVQEASTQSSPAPPTTRSARQIKVDLYETIRSQLRQVSGIRKAEMKWTNPERLSLYGVRLVGWPSDVPAANPSSLKSGQNQKLLELVEHGELRFEKTMMTGLEAPMPSESLQHTPEMTAEDFLWAYKAPGGNDTSVDGSTGAVVAAKLLSESTSSRPLEPADCPMLPEISPDDDLGIEFCWKGSDLLEGQHDGMPGLNDYDFGIGQWEGTAKFEEAEEDSPVERRGRKRARSSESEIDNSNRGDRSLMG